MCTATMIAAAAEGLGASEATAAAIGTTLQAAGTLAQGVAGYQQGQAQASAAEANAKIAEGQAKVALDNSVEEQRKVRRQGGQFAGKQKSLIGASGTGSGGSSLDLLLDTYSGIEDDANTIRMNGEREAWGYNVQAQNYKAQAKSAKSGAWGSLLGGVLGAGSTVMEAGAVDDSWYTSKSMGPTKAGGLTDDANSGRRG